jgi:hypothetical protein
MKYVYVVAYSMREYDYWVNNRPFNIEEVPVCVTGPNRLKGKHNISGYLIGQWYKRSDIYQIIEQLHICITSKPFGIYWDYVRNAPYSIENNKRIYYI